MSHEPHASTDDTETGSVPGHGPGAQSAMAGGHDDDRSEVPPQGAVPGDIAEAGEEQLKEGMEPGGRVAGEGDRNPDDRMHGSTGASGTPGAADRS